MLRFLNNTFKKFLLIFLKFYKFIISPLLGTNCRFYPTCSEYFYDAITRKGIIVGSYFGIKRILKCNPWGKSGHDPL